MSDIYRVALYDCYPDGDIIPESFHEQLFASDPASIDAAHTYAADLAAEQNGEVSANPFEGAAGYGYYGDKPNGHGDPEYPMIIIDVMTGPDAAEYHANGWAPAPTDPDA